MNSDINEAATRELASQATDLRLIPAPGGNFHPIDVSTKAMNQALAETDWSLTQQIPADPAVLECIPAWVRLLADRGRLPNLREAATEETEEWHWSFLRMLFAGLGHAHHAALVRALALVDAGCPWDADETPRQWQDHLLEARKLSHWPAALLLIPWKRFTLATMEKGGEGEQAVSARFNPWWMDACLAWHLIRHLRRSERHGLVCTYAGRWGATEPPGTSTSIATHLSVPFLARALGIPGGGKKSDHPLTTLATDLLTSTNRALLLSRRSLAQLPAPVLASPCAAYQADRGRQDRFFEHGLGITNTWVAQGGRVLPTTAMALSTDLVLGYDWSPAAVVGAALEGLARWEDRLVKTYDASQWPSQILSRCFPNLRWRSPAHMMLFDAVAILSVMRDAHPILDREFPLVLLLAQNPSMGDAIRNGKSACAKAILSLFSVDAPLTMLGLQPTTMDTRITLVGIRDHGTCAFDEWQLPQDGNHPFNREALATLCTGGTKACGLVLSNEPLYIRLRHSLVMNAKTVALPVDLESRSLFMWLDQLSDQQAADGEAYQEAISGKLGLRMRLAAVALAEVHGITGWVKGLDAGTTKDGWRFGLHRMAAAAIFATRYNVDLEQGLVAVDDAHRDMVGAYRRHTDAGESSGLLDLLQTGKTMRLGVDQLFDVPVETMGVLVERIRRHAGNADRAFTAGHLLHAVLESFLASDPANHLGTALTRYTGMKGYEHCSPRLISTLLTTDMMQKMPDLGIKRMFPGELGLAGWWLQRVESDDGRPPRFIAGCENPGADVGVLGHRRMAVRTSPNPGPPAPRAP